MQLMGCIVRREKFFVGSDLAFQAFGPQIGNFSD